MNVTLTKRTLKFFASPDWPANKKRKSVMIEGGHGLGKSQVVAQVAEELSRETGKPYGFIDMRLSQREVGDIIGMPRGVETYTIKLPTFVDGKLTIQEVEAKNVMVHDLPLWFPTDPDSRGIMFLDEIHYASKDVLQAIFELALDYRLNFTSLPKGWLVVAAGNENQDTYGGTTINPALYDRFMKVKFAPTVPEWQKYAEDAGVHAAVVKYISKFPTDLDPPEADLEPGKTYPSRRSWVSLSDVILQAGDDILRESDYLYLVTRGYVGETVAVSFGDFIKKDYKVYTPEDILNKFGKEMAEEFSTSVSSDLVFYGNEIVKYLAKGKVKLSKKQSDNLYRYLKVCEGISKEIPGAFWSKFIEDCREEATKWHKSSKEITDFVSGLFFKDAAMK